MWDSLSSPARLWMHKSVNQLSNKVAVSWLGATKRVNNTHGYLHVASFPFKRSGKVQVHGRPTSSGLSLRLDSTRQSLIRHCREGRDEAGGWEQSEGQLGGRTDSESCCIVKWNMRIFLLLRGFFAFYVRNLRWVFKTLAHPGNTKPYKSLIYSIKSTLDPILRPVPGFSSVLDPRWIPGFLVSGNDKKEIKQVFGCCKLDLFKQTLFFSPFHCHIFSFMLYLCTHKRHQTCWASRGRYSRKCPRWKGVWKIFCVDQRPKRAGKRLLLVWTGADCELRSLLLRWTNEVALLAATGREEQLSSSLEIRWQSFNMTLMANVFAHIYSWLHQQINNSNIGDEWELLCSEDFLWKWC